MIGNDVGPDVIQLIIQWIEAWQWLARARADFRQSTFDIPHENAKKRT
jgi:hypothetical protein